MSPFQALREPVRYAISGAISEKAGGLGLQPSLAWQLALLPRMVGLYVRVFPHLVSRPPVPPSGASAFPPRLLIPHHVLGVATAMVREGLATRQSAFGMGLQDPVEPVSLFSDP